MKIKYTPNPSIATGDNALRTHQAVNLGYVAIDSNTTDLQYFETTGLPKLLEKGTGYVIDPYTQWKKYFDFKKYSAQQQCKWQKCGDYFDGATDPTGLTEGATYFKFGLPSNLDTTEPPVPLQVGSFIVTWYVKVRGA